MQASVLLGVVAIMLGPLMSSSTTTPGQGAIRHQSSYTVMVEFHLPSSLRGITGEFLAAQFVDDLKAKETGSVTYVSAPRKGEESPCAQQVHCDLVTLTELEQAMSEPPSVGLQLTIEARGSGKPHPAISIPLKRGKLLSCDHDAQVPKSWGLCPTDYLETVRANLRQHFRDVEEDLRLHSRE